MAELYRMVDRSEEKYGRPSIIQPEPVGYTEDDVRRLAAWAEQKRGLGEIQDIMRPFRALLDGGK